MFNLVKKKLIILIISTPLTWGYCLLLKNQECKVRKVIIDNDYMTYPYKIEIDRCIGDCNDKDNPYFKVCSRDNVKNISIKSFDLISNKNVLKNISFHQTCKCGCLLNENVCNNLQKWNKDKCRCECLKIKDFDICSSWNVNNCRCEMKKLAALTIETERFSETSENKTIILINKDCKLFIAVSVLFLSVSIILTGIMIYFYIKSKNSVLPY